MPVPRRIIFYNDYFVTFYTAQTEDVRRKINRFDKGNLVVLFNGFQKKSQKTPPDQIARAERLKNEYFKEKEAR